MLYPSDQLSIAQSALPFESARPLQTRPKQSGVRMLCETVAVTAAAILAIRLLVTSPAAHTAWLAAPAVLVTAALVPTLIRKDEFAEIGLTVRQIRCALSVLSRVSAVVFPSLLLGIWILKSRGFQLPLRPAIPREHGWLGWLLYQFMYVAVAEEVFFRGYVQANILKLADALKWLQPRLQKAIVILLSAACFAIAHIVVQGRMASALTFLPGLILAWLFIRTRSLLAPILFHGLANTGYCLMAAAFA